jgi:hypothetical protein
MQDQCDRYFKSVICNHLALEHEVIIIPKTLNFMKSKKLSNINQIHMENPRKS